MSGAVKSIKKIFSGPDIIRPKKEEPKPLPQPDSEEARAASRRAKERLAKSSGREGSRLKDEQLGDYGQGRGGLAGSSSDYS